MTGRGAWSYGPYHLGMAVPDQRVAAGIGALKRELVAVGFGAGVVVDLPVWGRQVSDQLVAFQRHEGLVADGKLGPTTARRLFQARTRQAEAREGIPGHLAGRQGTLESSNDPVAEGFVDPDDEGWAQIHLPFHPDVSQAEAWDPAFAVAWLARQLRAGFDRIADWDGAVAAYNVGSTYAGRWVRAGKPAAGLVVDGIDWYTRAHDYVAKVKAQPL